MRAEAEPRARIAGVQRGAARAALVVLALAAASACATGCSHLRSVGEPRTGTLHADDALARAAILRALAGRHFLVEADNASAIVATYEDARTWLRIEVTYDASGYAIAYRESIGLDETVADDGEPRVDGRYHQLVGALSSDIERVIGLPDTRAYAASLPAPGGGGSSGAAAPPTAGGMVAAASGEVAGAAGPTAGAASAPYVTPATAGYATSTVPTSGYVGGAAGGDAAATTGPARPTRSLYEVLVPGIVLWVGSWAVNWSITLGISRDPEMIGLSFLPIVGPFVELGFLQWSLYERWTGLWYPVAGLLQIVGLVMTVVGASVHVPDGDAPDVASGFGRTWTLLPSAGADSAGLTFAATF